MLVHDCLGWGFRNGAAVCCISKQLFLNGFCRVNLIKSLISLNMVLNVVHLLHFVGPLFHSDPYFCAARDQR